MKFAAVAMAVAALGWALTLAGAPARAGEKPVQAEDPFTGMYPIESKAMVGHPGSPPPGMPVSVETLTVTVNVGCGTGEAPCVPNGAANGGNNTVVLFSGNSSIAIIAGNDLTATFGNGEVFTGTVATNVAP